MALKAGPLSWAWQFGDGGNSRHGGLSLQQQPEGQAEGGEEDEKEKLLEQ